MSGTTAEDEIIEKINEYKEKGYDVDEIARMFTSMLGGESVIDWYSQSRPQEKGIVGDILIITAKTVMGINFEKDRKYDLVQVSKEKLRDGMSVHFNGEGIELTFSSGLAGFRETFDKEDGDKVRKIINEIKQA